MSHLSYVTEIVDHHEDEKSHEQVTDNKRLIAFENGAATVASTCTLVTERLFNSTISIIDGSLGLALLGVILLDSVNILLGVILLDSVNMNVTSGRKGYPSFIAIQFGGRI